MPGAVPELKFAEFVVGCDVDSPFHGPKGAAYVYAPQKGATPQIVELLDNGLKHFADIIKGTTGKDISEMPGAGAAGGLGGAFKAFRYWQYAAGQRFNPIPHSQQSAL